jgi:hypothetical protein
MNPAVPRGNKTDVLKKPDLLTHSRKNLVNTGYWEGSPPQGLGTPRRDKFGFRE